MKILRALIISLTVGLVPALAFAQTPEAGIRKLSDLIKNITNNILTELILLLGTFALVAFFFGMVRFIIASREGDAKQISAGKQFMLWSVIAIFVMFSIWGIVSFAQNIFGFTQTNITIPTINSSGSPRTQTQDPLSPAQNQGTPCPGDPTKRYRDMNEFYRICNQQQPTTVQ